MGRRSYPQPSPETPPSAETLTQLFDYIVAGKGSRGMTLVLLIDYDQFTQLAAPNPPLDRLVAAKTFMELVRLTIDEEFDEILGRTIGQLFGLRETMLRSTADRRASAAATLGYSPASFVADLETLSGSGVGFVGVVETKRCCRVRRGSRNLLSDCG